MQLFTSPDEPFACDDFKTMATALDALQAQYLLVKERAQERECLTTKENSLLTLRVTSLETRVSELQACLQLSIQDKLATILSLQNDIAEFQLQSDLRGAEFLGNTASLQERIDELEAVVQGVDGPTSISTSVSPLLTGFNQCGATAEDASSTLDKSVFVDYPIEPSEDADHHLTVAHSTPILKVDPLHTNPDVASCLLAATDMFTIVNRLKSRSMREGETWYLISRSGWTAFAESRHWQNFPMTNEDIVDHQGILLPGLSLGTELDSVPSEAWTLLTSYGFTAKPLSRQVVKTDGMSLELEIYPIRLKVYFAAPLKLCPVGNYTPTIGAMHSTVLFSCIHSLLPTTPDTPADGFRFWRIPNHRAINPGWYYPSSKLSDGLKIDDVNATLTSMGWEDGDAVVIEPKLAGRWLSSLHWVVASKAFKSPSPPPQRIRFQTL